jgi:hypothetical protein
MSFRGKRSKFEHALIIYNNYYERIHYNKKTTTMIINTNNHHHNYIMHNNNLPIPIIDLNDGGKLSIVRKRG